MCLVWVAAPSRSNGQLAIPMGISGSSVSVTDALAMVSPSRPARRERPFCTLSAENTPQNVASRSPIALFLMTTGYAPLFMRPASSFISDSRLQLSASVSASIASRP